MTSAKNAGSGPVREPFRRLTAIAAPLPESGIDTDQLCPARFVKVPYGEGYDRILLHDRRFDADGRERPDFVLNDPAYRGAQVLVAGANFGIGSSREGAVAALEAYGFRAIIASSFGDILFDNCFRRGLLPIVLAEERVVALIDWLQQDPGRTVTVDLEAGVIEAMDDSLSFEVSPMRRTCLLEGIDEFSVTERFAEDIDRHERAVRDARPWFPVAGAISGGGA